MRAARLRPAVIAVATAVALVLLPIARPAEAVPGAASAVFVNELHYDNAGTDAGEFVEVVATDGSDASGYRLVLYNGANSAQYDDDTLGAARVTENGVSYYVVEYPSNGIQNGAPDGIALVDGSGGLVQFLSYEGTFAASGGPAAGQTSTDIGPTEGSGTATGASLQLGGSGATAGDFAWQAPQGATPGAVNAGQTFTDGGPGPDPTPSPSTPTAACGTQDTPISAIQGAGGDSPVVGEVRSVEALVAGDYQAGDGDDGTLDPTGYYLVDDAADDDGDPLTSEGLFVADGGGLDVAAGDVVRVTGTVAEQFGQTALTAPSAVELCANGGARPAPVPVTLPVEDPPAPDGVDGRERYEGMLVAFPTLTVTETRNVDDFGEIRVADDGVLVNPTEITEPGSPEQAVLEARNDARNVLLDDGFGGRVTDVPYITPSGTIRRGDTVAGLEGIFGFGFGSFRVQPTSEVGFTEQNPRTARPEDVGGDVRVASYNVLNYFTTTRDENGDFSRGAGDEAELAEQQAKIVAGITALDADVVALQEIENDANPASREQNAQETLVAALNAAEGDGAWAGVELPAAFDGTAPGTSDAIRVALIFRPAAVTPVGEPRVLIDEAFDNARAPLAQAFAAAGDTFSVIANHFKSKGSGSGPGNVDSGDGQGNSNADRVSQAQALTGFIAQIVTEVDADVISLGDYNAYSLEDPIDVFRDAGYSDAIAGEHPLTERYSFVFDGEQGALDHAIVTPEAAAKVTGTDSWHPNADEPDAYAYFGPEAFFAPDVYRASDHDPVVIGLDLDDDNGTPPGDGVLSVLGRYTGDAAEINAFDPTTDQLYVTNGDLPGLDVLDVTAPSAPTLTAQRTLGVPVAGVTSVAVRGADGLVAVAGTAEVVTDPGTVTFLAPDGTQLAQVGVPALPDQLTFTPDGSRVVVANEGEPDDGVDPAGAITLIDVPDAPVTAPFMLTTTELGLDGVPAPTSIEDGGDAFVEAGTTFAQSAEPEYAAVSTDGATAYVTLQESNALAIVDLAGNKVTDLVGLGVTDHGAGGAGLDPSDRDGGIAIAPYDNVLGVYQPDAIATFEVADQTYTISANEGDSRGDTDERVEDLTLDPAAFPAGTQDEAVLGRLQVYSQLGDTDDDGDYDQLYALGGRSFSIRDAAGALVFDSGDQLEQLTAERVPGLFNSDESDPAEFDSRSDNKGPEPEGVTVGVLGGTPYGFLLLERTGGIVVLDLSDPTAPRVLDYVNSATGSPATQDAAPEGVTFIAPEDSPTEQALLAVSYEATGDTTLYAIGIEVAPPDTTAPGAPALNEPADVTSDNAATYSVSGLVDETSTVTVTITDAGGASVTAETTAAPAFDVFLDVSELADGPLEITATATDLAGNTGPAATATVTKDTSGGGNPEDGRTLYALTVPTANEGSELVAFGADDPSDLQARAQILTLEGETLTAVALDVRPATGELYVLDDAGRLLTVSTNLVAEPVDDAFFGDATVVATLTEQPFSQVVGFDFNPTVDQIRLLTADGENARVDPETGAVTDDAPLAFADGTEGAPAVVAAAYSLGAAAAGTTTLYDLDAERDALLTQEPANDGQLQTVGPLGVDVETSTGFDIGPDDSAYVRYRGSELLGRVDVGSGALTNLGTIVSSAFDLTGLAVSIGEDELIAPQPPGGGADEAVRLGGADRIETAIEISRDGFADGEAGAVVLSRSDLFPDALAGTPLAIAEDAPLLLTPSAGLRSDVKAELRRVLPPGGTVFLLGGPAALSGQVALDLEALGFAMVRFGGPNRFATASLIARRGLGSPATVVLADGTNYADAVAAGAGAGQVSGAVLLTSGGDVPDATQAYLDANSEAELFAAGGPAARAVPDATPLVGADRIQTSVAVAQEFFDAPPVVGIATGSAFPDALAGGVAAGRAGGPVLLTFRETLDPNVEAYLQANAASIDRALIFGSTAALSDAVRGSVDAAIRD